MCGCEQCQPEGFTVHVICVDFFFFFYVWVIQNELLDWLISPCELIMVLLL